MMNTRRSSVNKGRSASAFRSSNRKTKMLNVSAPMRGGYRL